MVVGQIKRGLEVNPLGIGDFETVRPLKDTGASSISRTFSLSGQNSKKFPKNLGGNDNGLGRQFCQKL